MANFSGRDSDAALAVAPNGRIVAVGSTELPGEGSKFAIARFRGAAGESASTARTYQAEAAILSGPVVSRANGGYTGAGYADYLHASHDYVEWKVNLPSAALYELTLRYANGGNHDRPLDLSVNGQVVTPRLSFAPTWGWSVWKDVSATASLSAGVNTIRLTATGLSGPNVDALTIRAAPRQ